MNYPTVNKKVIDWVVWLALTKIYTKFNMIFINMMMIWKKLYFQKPKWQHKKGSTKKFTLPFNMYYIDVIPYLNMGFVSFPTFFSHKPNGLCFCSIIFHSRVWIFSSLFIAVCIMIWVGIRYQNLVAFNLWCLYTAPWPQQGWHPAWAWTEVAELSHRVSSAAPLLDPSLFLYCSWLWVVAPLTN